MTRAADQAQGCAPVARAGDPDSLSRDPGFHPMNAVEAGG